MSEVYTIEVEFPASSHSPISPRKHLSLQTLKEKEIIYVYA